MNNLKKQHEQLARARAQSQKIAVDKISRYHPHGDLVLLRLELERYTAGGIIVPDTVAPQIPIGRVLELGPQAEGFKVGELVMFALQAGVSIDSDHWLIEAGKIACHVDEPSRVVA